MFQTIYRLRLLVQETSQYHQIHLCALKEKEPTFNELSRKIQRILENDKNLSDYYIQTNDKIILSDDQTLQNALKSSSSDQSKLDITLCRKSTQLLDDLRSISSSTRLPIKKSSVLQLTDNTAVPVIKPTVLRWTTPAMIHSPPPSVIEPITTTTHHHIRRYSSISQDNDDDDESYRKDSGISMDDEPQRKKQRVMSAEHHHRHSLKLPDPPLLNRHMMTTSLHPLDIARPSTAPPPISPPASPYPRLNYILGPTLPALSSITSPTSCSASLHETADSKQLAPIYNYHTSPPPNNKQPYKRSKSIATSHSSIFLCEHVNENGKVCGQTFRRSYDLSRHQTIHLENRPFCYCDKCGKKFTRMDALRRHERVQGHTSKHRSMSMVPLQKTSSV